MTNIICKALHSIYNKDIKRTKTCSLMPSCVDPKDNRMFGIVMIGRNGKTYFILDQVYLCDLGNIRI
ncbi:unnamed protein product [Rhizophagus irregularis]|nr:unnamed protein product [Rhizophagus irregularis]